MDMTFYLCLPSSSPLVLRCAPLPVTPSSSRAYKSTLEHRTPDDKTPLLLPLHPRHHPLTRHFQRPPPHVSPRHSVQFEQRCTPGQSHPPRANRIVNFQRGGLIVQVRMQLGIQRHELAPLHRVRKPSRKRRHEKLHVTAGLVEEVAQDSTGHDVGAGGTTQAHGGVDRGDAAIPL